MRTIELMLILIVDPGDSPISGEIESFEFGFISSA